MPLTYRIDIDAQMLLIHGEGVITQPERIQTILGWIKDPAFRPGLDAFCDFSAAQSTPKLSELREIVAIIGEHAPAIGHSKLAILTSKPITFGVARVFEALAQIEETPLKVRVFFNRDKAWAWLRPHAPVLQQH
jgi:hypothetical protein